MAVKIEKTEYGKIIEMYKNGLSCNKISKEYNVSVSTIRSILIKNGIERRDNSHKSMIYTLDEHYFDIIDTQNKAYILGLLWADGCNYTKLNHIKIELQERDKDILDSINIEIESNRPLKYIDLHSKNENWQSTYRLSIVNKHMSKTLNNIGMVPNKSLVLTFPEWLDTSFYSSFIRGYMDGDGHIHYGKKSKFITCVGTQMFCESIKKICENIIGIKVTIHDVPDKKESITKILYICGMHNIKKFLDFIYNDSDLYIKRKYDTYLKFCNYYNNVNNSLVV